MFDPNITSFMENEFNETRLLWAYRAINNASQLGVSRTDIWRLAQLYLSGGVYLDSDTYIGSPFDVVISKENSTMVLTVERRRVIPCYSDSYALSDAALARIFGESTYRAVLSPSSICNRGILATAGHPILYAALNRTVELIALEYLRTSALSG